MAVEWLIELQQALIDYQGRAKQASNRMHAIQRVVKAELERRLAPAGPLLNVELERSVRGKHRTKGWDLVLSYARRQQLAISTKAIIDNPGGSVPNRVDDALGECVNVHAYDPGMVLGYLFVMDRRCAQQLNREKRRWIDVFADSLGSFSGRRSELDAHELFEAATLIEVDFGSTPPTLSFHPRLLSWEEFVDVLVNHVRARNPIIDRLLSLRNV